MSPNSLLYVGIAVVIGAMLVPFFFAGEKKIVAHRKDARALAQILVSEGMSYIPKALNDFADGDLLGVARSLREAHDAMLDPKRRKADFAKIFETELAARFNDPDERAALLKKIDALTAATAAPSIAPVAA